MLLAGSPASALVQPLMMNFQGKLVNPATGDPQNGAAVVTFKIYNSPSGGTPLWTEANDGVALNNGVFAVTVGSNTALSRDLFLGASAYLEVTVNSVNGVADGVAMTPRQPLVMSPYAVTANQLSDLNDVRLIAGPTYSTFTSAGNLVVPEGVQASTGVFTSWVSVASATVTGGPGSDFDLTVASGLAIQQGTLAVNGAGGVDVAYGLQVTTIDFTNLTADPPGNSGFMYYNSSTGAIKVMDGTGAWNFVFGQSLGRMNFVTTDNTAATAAKAAAGTILVTPFYLPGPIMVNQLRVRVTTTLGAAGDVGVYSETGTLLLNGGSGSLTTAAAAKTITPVQTGTARFLEPGQYYGAITWNSTTGVVGGNNLTVAGLVNRVGTVTGGGLVLPATISVTGITAGTIEPFIELNP